MSAPVRVLVVDDDAGVRYTLREILASEGLAVDEAADGAVALARLEAQPAALVVTDLRMPGMDGMALLRTLAARPGGGTRAELLLPASRSGGDRAA